MMELHPLCTLFPRLEGAEFEALKADIVANGLREPITVHEGMVLDGGNRYRACLDAGVEPKLQTFNGDDPASFVFSANFHRRHLTAGQKAVIVAQAEDWANAQRVGRPEKSGSTAGLKTVADRAAESHASERAQRMADQLARQAPELAKQVAEGKLSLPKAHAQLAPKPVAPRASAPAVTRHPPAAIGQVADSIHQPTPAPAAPQSLVQQVLDQQAEQAPICEVLPAPETEAEADPFEELMVDYVKVKAERDALQVQKEKLEKRIAMLTADGLAAKVDDLADKCARFDSLATSRFNDIADRDKTIKSQRDFLDGLRRAAGLPKGGDLAAWIKAAAQRAA